MQLNRSLSKQNMVKIVKNLTNRLRKRRKERPTKVCVYTTRKAHSPRKSTRYRKPLEKSSITNEK